MKIKLSMFACVLCLSGCLSQGYSPPPLTKAEECAENGLALQGTKAASASGVIGEFVGGSGDTHSCGQPKDQHQICEVQGFSQSAVVKRTHPGPYNAAIGAANQVRIDTYNQCMAAAAPQ